jgi:hypothetical protein
MVNTWLTRLRKILGSFDGQSGLVSAEAIRWMPSTASEKGSVRTDAGNLAVDDHP